jgi:hypothetical protein
MPVIQKKVTIAAGAVNDNVLTGSQFEFLPFNAKVDAGMTQSAAGLVVDAYSGQDVLCEQFEPPIFARYPVNPDDFTLTDVAGAGERLKVRVRNTTAGPLDFYLSAVITPI